MLANDHVLCSLIELYSSRAFAARQEDDVSRLDACRMLINDEDLLARGITILDDAHRSSIKSILYILQ